MTYLATPASPLRGLMLALTIALVALAARCGPARNALANVTPTVPGPAPCVDGAQRCNDLVPERCGGVDGAGRWWPLHPLGADLRPAPCGVACVVSDGGAHCAGAAADGGAQ